MAELTKGRARATKTERRTRTLRATGLRAFGAGFAVGESSKRRAWAV